MRALIADDEPLARALLRQMLEEQGVHVAAEAGEAGEAIDMAEKLNPDVVFLDIRMPGMSGIDAAGVFNQLDPAPLVILVTGYSEYAVQAFDRAALDYILKPISSERLTAALDRAREQLVLHRKAKRAEALKRGAQGSSIPRLPLRFKGSFRVIAFESILYAMTSGKGVVVKTRTAEFKTNYTLAYLEEVLPAVFMRVHASCIVNLLAIDEILLMGNHNYAIKLTSGEELPVGRPNYAKLQERLGFPAE